jgi:hypothetical protein
MPVETRHSLFLQASPLLVWFNKSTNNPSPHVIVDVIMLHLYNYHIATFRLRSTTVVISLLQYRRSSATSLQSPLHHFTTSPFHHFTTSPLHHFTTHHFTTSPHHTISPLHHFTISPHGQRYAHVSHYYWLLAFFVCTFKLCFAFNSLDKWLAKPKRPICYSPTNYC